MNLSDIKTVEELAAALKPYLSGGRNFSGLNVGAVGSPPTAGDIKVADDIQALGAILVGSPSSPLTGAGDLTTADDVRVEGDLTVVGSGLVTNGNSHDHDGGDGNQIPTGGLAANSVDDTKAGNRVPQFYRRQGGSSSNWSSEGSSNYTPGAVRMQAGVRTVPIADGQGVGSTAISFPTSFGNTPIVITSLLYNGNLFWTGAFSISSSGFTIHAGRTITTPAASSSVFWLAIGEE